MEKDFTEHIKMRISRNPSIETYQRLLRGKGLTHLKVYLASHKCTLEEMF